MQNLLSRWQFSVTAKLMIVLAALAVLLMGANATIAQNDPNSQEQANSTSTEAGQNSQQNATATRMRNENSSVNQNARTANNSPFASARKTIEERRQAFAERRAALTEMREEKRLEIEARREAQIASLNATIQQNVTRRSKALTNQLRLSVSKLQSIADDMRSRLVVLSGEGVSTDGAMDTLDETDALLGDARDSLDNMGLEIEYVVTSDTPRNDWQDLKEQLLAIREVVRQSKNTMRQTVTILKNEMSQESSIQNQTEDPEATGTTTNNS